MARRRRRTERTALRLLAAAVVLAWAWQTYPVLTGLVAVVAVGVLAATRYERRRQVSRPRQAWVYHLPGPPGTPLVYVGYTTDPQRRMAQHQGYAGPASWFAPYVDWSRVQWFGPWPTAEQARRAEADHIHTYEPWANRQRYEELRRPRLLRDLGQHAA